MNTPSLQRLIHGTVAWIILCVFLISSFNIASAYLGTVSRTLEKLRDNDTQITALETRFEGTRTQRSELISTLDASILPSSLANSLEAGTRELETRRKMIAEKLSHSGYRLSNATQSPPQTLNTNLSKLTETLIFQGPSSNLVPAANNLGGLPVDIEALTLSLDPARPATATLSLHLILFAQEGHVDEG